MLPPPRITERRRRRRRNNTATTTNNKEEEENTTTTTTTTAANNNSDSGGDGECVRIKAGFKPNSSGRVKAKRPAVGRASQLGQSSGSEKVAEYGSASGSVCSWDLEEIEFSRDVPATVGWDTPCSCIKKLGRVGDAERVSLTWQCLDAYKVGSIHCVTILLQGVCLFRALAKSEKINTNKQTNKINKQGS